MNIDFQDFKYQQINSGEQLCYRQYGESTESTLILIHGNYSSQRYWDVIIQELVQNFQYEENNADTSIDRTSIVTIDMRGFGRSSYNKPTEKLEDLALDIIEFIDKKQFKNINLIGWGMGGVISMVIAAQISKKVQNIMLVDSASYYGYPFTQYDENMNAEVKLDTNRFRNRLEQQLLPVFKDPNQENKLEKIKEIMAVILYKTESQTKIKSLFNTLCEETLMQRNSIECTIGIHNFDFFIKNPDIKVKCPTFIYHGQDDQVFPYGSALKNLDFIGPDLCVKVLVRIGCGHCPFLQYPDEFSSIILENFYNKKFLAIEEDQERQTFFPKL